MLRRVARCTTALVYTQILLGATMRHNDAGLAIPDFPLAFGHVLPPVEREVAIHFAHRAGRADRPSSPGDRGPRLLSPSRRRELVRPRCPAVPRAMQITLGAFVIWSGKDPVINTAHVVNGALVLGTSLVLTLRSFRAGSRSTVPVRGRRRRSASTTGARS
jgi:cytochrome c oxidase assembly protein subunit 15